MSLKSFSALARQVREKRGSVGVRATSKEIGISPATLSRVEAGRMPDLETFAKLCAWLDADPAEFLDLAAPAHAGEDAANLAVHCKTDRELPTRTAEALARMVEHAVRHYWVPGIDPDAEV